MWRVHIIRSQQHDDDETVEGAFLFSPFFSLLSCFNKQSHLVKCSITAVCCWSFLQLFPPSVVVKNIFSERESERASEGGRKPWFGTLIHLTWTHNLKCVRRRRRESQRKRRLTKQKWLHDWYSEDVFEFLNVWAKTRSLRFFRAWIRSRVEASFLPLTPLPP